MYVGRNMLQKSVDGVMMKHGAAAPPSMISIALEAEDRSNEEQAAC